MDDNDKKEFAAIMVGLAEEMGGTLSETGLKLKWNALNKYTLDEFSQGVSYLIENRETTYPPVPRTKEIIDAIKIVNNPVNVISIEALAEIQANEVLGFFKYYGSQKAPNFNDPLTQRLMTQTWPYNSWGKSLTEKEKPRWRKDFIKAYTVIAKTARDCERLNISETFCQLTTNMIKKIPLAQPKLAAT